MLTYIGELSPTFITKNHFKSFCPVANASWQSWFPLTFDVLYFFLRRKCCNALIFPMTEDFPVLQGHFVRDQWSSAWQETYGVHSRGPQGICPCDSPNNGHSNVCGKLRWHCHYCLLLLLVQLRFTSTVTNLRYERSSPFIPMLLFSAAYPEKQTT